ncbi:MAG: CHAT domain-containing protein [Planctomycetes bacterium]|nr:CHAT domain-containing protein [Planctomycetota bacterium]
MKLRVMGLAVAWSAGWLQAQGPSEADWIARVQALTAAGDVRAADAIEALGLLDLHAKATDPLVDYWRYRLARGLQNFAGRTLETAPGTPGAALRVPERVALWGIAQQAAERHGDVAIRADAAIGIGEALLLAGRHREADASLRRALELPAGNELHCIAKTRLASIAMHTGRLAVGRALLEEAKQLEPQDDSHRSRLIRANLQGAWGEFHLMLGLVDVAARHEVAEERAFGPQEFAVLKRELDLLIATQRYAEVLERAHAWRASCGDSIRPRDAKHLDLFVAQAELRLPERRAAAREALRRMWSSDVPEFAAAARVRSALAALDDGDLEDARRALEGTADLYGQFARMSALIARTRLALHEESVPLPELELELEGVIDEHLAEWDRTEPRPGGVGFLHFRQRRGLLALLMTVRMRRHTDGVQRALRDLLRFSDRGSFARRLGLGSTEVRDALALVPAGGCAVLWLPSMVGTHVFVLADGTVHHFVGGEDEATRAAVRQFRAAVIEPQADAAKIRELGQRVRTGVFPPGAWELIAKRRPLVLIGSEEWGRLPFEALPGSDELYLGWSHAIAHLPSVAVGRWLAQRAVPRPWKSARLSAARDIAPELLARWSLEPLELSDARLRAILEPLNLERAELAPLTPDLGSDGENYHVLITHGVYDPERERPAGLVTTGDGEVLWSDGLETKRVAPHVLALACGTARAARRLGEDGGNHLGAAFFAAGASVVIHASEDLELASSLELAKAFHEALASSSEANAAEALRLARHSVGSRAGFEAPAYHALLQVSGLGYLPIEVPSSRRSLWWWTLLLAPGALAWWLYRERRMRTTPSS